MFNGISVWWHVAGVAVIIGILIVVPDNHASFNEVFTDRINNSGFSQDMFWWYVLPLGFLLTQYTITGFDASPTSRRRHTTPRTPRRRACGARSSGPR